MTHDSGRDDVRRAYRRLRVDAGLTQLETETQARLTKGRFWRLENGFENATDTEREALAAVLRCDISAIPVLSQQVAAS